MALNDAVPSSATDVFKRNAEDADRILNQTANVVNRVGTTLETFPSSTGRVSTAADAAQVAIQTDVDEAEAAKVAALASYTQWNSRGDWVTATSYAIGDIWNNTVTSTWYLVLNAYTSGANVDLDIAGANVTVLQGEKYGAFEGLSDAVAFVIAHPQLFPDNTALSTSSYRTRSECLAISIPYPDGGSADYVVVPDGTGIADLGSFLQAASKQLQLVVNDSVNIKQFGVNGVDDTQGVRDAGLFCEDKGYECIVSSINVEASIDVFKETETIWRFCKSTLDGQDPVRSEVGVSLYQGKSTETDKSLLGIVRRVNHTGGSAGYVNGGMYIDLNIESSPDSWEFAQVVDVNSQSMTELNETVGSYFRMIKAGNDKMWPTATIVQDISGNDIGSIVGCEYNQRAEGPNLTTNRVGVNVLCGTASQVANNADLGDKKEVNTVSGSFIPFETITDTSGNTASLIYLRSFDSLSVSGMLIDNKYISGEIIQGDISGARVVADWYDYSAGKIYYDPDTLTGTFQGGESTTSLTTGRVATYTQSNILDHSEINLRGEIGTLSGTITGQDSGATAVVAGSQPMRRATHFAGIAVRTLTESGAGDILNGLIVQESAAIGLGKGQIVIGIRVQNTGRYGVLVDGANQTSGIRLGNDFNGDAAPIGMQVAGNNSLAGISMESLQGAIGISFLGTSDFSTAAIQLAGSGTVGIKVNGNYDTAISIPDDSLFKMSTAGDVFISYNSSNNRLEFSAGGSVRGHLNLTGADHEM